jgi:hypothetical protein
VAAPVPALQSTPLTSFCDLLEPERDLPGSFPMYPVSEEGIGILGVKVMVLIESNIPGQVLGKDEVIAGLFHSGPWYSFLSTTLRNL